MIVGTELLLLVLRFQFDFIINNTSYSYEPIWLATPGEKVKRFTKIKICLKYIQEDFQSHLA